MPKNKATPYFWANARVMSYEETFMNQYWIKIIHIFLTKNRPFLILRENHLPPPIKLTVDRLDYSPDHVYVVNDCYSWKQLIF